MLITLENYQQLAWDKMEQLIPVIVQHYFSGKVLMQGYMNTQALEQSLTARNITFYSRSKQRLWTKGETSGNFLTLIKVTADCDQDCLIILADPVGPACHTGAETCFHIDSAPELSFLASLEQLINQRLGADPNTSYTARLFNQGIKRIAQKVGEEGVETALAASAGDKDETKNESADLIFHLLVLLTAKGISLNEVIQILKQRHQKTDG